MKPISGIWDMGPVAQVALLVAALLVFSTLVVFALKLAFPGRNWKELQDRVNAWWIMAALFLGAVSVATWVALVFFGFLRPAAAADYFERTAAIAWFSHALINILPIARKRITSANHPILKMRQTVEAGESLILFPEGTRGTGEALGTFHPGIAHLVEQVPGLSVVPCYLANMGRALPKGEFVPVPFFCEIRIGAPVRPEGNREEILAALRAEVLALRDGALQTQAP